MMFGFGGWIGWLFMASWWLLAAGAVTWLIVAVRARGKDGGSTARQVLDERFAAGEVTAEEYRERRALLEHR
jgi:putative membrane protein